MESPVKPGDLILTMNHTAKAFKLKYKKETYRVVKVNGNQVDIRDYRGNISTVHITDMKKTTLTDQVADDYIELCNEGRFTKKCVPRGYIPDLDWTTIHNEQNQPIKPVKQEEDLTETTVTPAAPTRLRDHQTVILDPKLSSNQPPSSRNNRNAIQHCWTPQNAIQLKWRLTMCKWTQTTRVHLYRWH